MSKTESILPSPLSSTVSSPVSPALGSKQGDRGSIPSVLDLGLTSPALVPLGTGTPSTQSPPKGRSKKRPSPSRSISKEKGQNKDRNQVQALDPSRTTPPQDKKAGRKKPQSPSAPNASRDSEGSTTDLCGKVVSPPSRKPRARRPLAPDSPVLEIGTKRSHLMVETAHGFHVRCRIPDLSFCFATLDPDRCTTPQENPLC